MADEPLPATAVPTQEPAPVSAPSSTSDQAPAEQPEGQAAEDSVEIEYGGEKYMVPKALEKGIMQERDYTQKSMTVAERARAIEAQEASIKTERENLRQRSEAKDVVGAMNLTLAQLERRLNSPEYQQLRQTDPSRASLEFQDYTMLKQNRDEVTGRIRADEDAENLRTQQETAKRFEAGLADLQKSIPDWGADKAEKVAAHGTSYGFSRAELAKVTDHRMIKVLHDAMVGRQLLEAQRKAAAVPATTAQPVQRVTPGRSAPVQGLSDKQSVENWITTRNKQDAAKRH